MGQIELQGIYQGKNLYVQNPFSPNGVGFCTTEVRVNGNVTTDETQSSAYDIDLGCWRLKLGDPVNVIIIHKDGCKPKVLNPEAIKPKSTFDVVSMQVVQQGADVLLKWETKNERGKLDFTPEQLRWNKWIKLQAVEGSGVPTPSIYQTKVNLHTGENKFRVSQTDYSGHPRTSKTVTFNSTAAGITFSPKKATTEITLSANSLWEIYDQYGNIVQKGFGTKIDVGGLAKGPYFLNYDNTTGEFYKM